MKIFETATHPTKLTFTIKLKMSEFSKENVVKDIDSILERYQVLQAELNELRTLAAGAKSHIQANSNPDSGLSSANASIAVVKLKAVLEHLKSCNAEIRSAFEEAMSAYTAVKAEKEKSN
ncbi:MAG: hypothetical protein HC795_16005 [Coleofasciculaceae cyanobacterium RL_1_1]|nr:hypothetical protein [Coleofasciculaceae cyanobacterium RL_1_1]